jgi:hypothetical protein
MDVQKMSELRAIAHDSRSPMSTRQAAAAKYDKMLDEAVREMDGFLDKIKADYASGTPGS